MSRITTPIELPAKYAEWCGGKNGFAHICNEDGALIRCEQLCEPAFDPRYQEALAQEIDNAQ